VAAVARAEVEEAEQAGRREELVQEARSYRAMA